MSVDSLKELQTQFQDYLLGESQEVLASLKGAPQFSKEQGMQVYQDAYLSRLTDALKADFPVLQKAMSASKFKTLAIDYILTIPSKQVSIRSFSDRFANFLKMRADKHSEFFAELSTFERALSDAFDCRDSATVSLDFLREIPANDWPSLRVEFHSSMQLLYFNWNTVNYWQRRSQKLPASKRMYKKPVPYLIWRQEYETYFNKLTGMQAWVIEQFMSDEPLEAVCLGLSRWVANNKLFSEMACLLQEWTRLGIISNLAVPV